jgi:UDP-N-acetylglucosamine 2-epimerase (non-hydrolysing)
MRPHRLALIIGTRPELIKLMPVVVAARERPDEFDVRIVRTGQHRDIVDSLMAEFDLVADVDLGIMREDQEPSHVLAESVRGLSGYLAQTATDWVLVQGDTTSTLAGALAAFYNGTRIGHVEAGLRSGHLRSPFPEEGNRVLTARLADLHFAPTPLARTHLLQEGIAAAKIVVTGNTVVDALRLTRARGRRSGAATGAASSRYILVTAHRRENHGAPLERICDALLLLLERYPDLIARVPVHPSPKVRDAFERRLGHHPRALLTPPLGYSAFVAALDGAALVLTDSGGVQEECAVLGKPVLVMRANTERAEAVDAGVALLVGADAKRIAEAAALLLDDRQAHARMAQATTAFGDGNAAVRILDALLAAGHDSNV